MKDAQKAQECAADFNACPQGKPSYPPARLFPRARLRLNSAFKAADFCLHCVDRCRKEGPNMSDLFHVRGGGTAEVVATLVGDTTVESFPAITTPYGIPLNAWKIIFQIFLTLMNVACWLIPLKSKKMSENKVALSLANSFSGGVFLSLAFGHLLPECTHGFEGMNEATPYMLALGGYMLIFFVEKIAFDTDKILHEAHHSKGVENGQGTAVLSSGRGAVILLGALAVHSILEMMALGLADSFGDSALLSLSIALHQVRTPMAGCYCINIMGEL